MTTELSSSTPSSPRHDIVDEVISGFLEGSLVLNPKSPHKALNGSLGEIYDHFMRDISLYTWIRGSDPFMAIFVRHRLESTIIQLRAYSLLQPKSVNPDGTQSRQTEEIAVNNNLLRELVVLIRSLFRRLDRSPSESTASN